MAEVFRKGKSEPGYFQIGSVVLDVPPEDIQITRNENLQLVDYLLNTYSLKIPTGRAVIRVDIGFRVIVGEKLENLDTLQRLLAMTRTTPFVPVYNKYLSHNLPTSDRNINLSSPASIPMAIFGFSVLAGGESQEFIDCRMSLVLWNPRPFMGVEEFVWTEDAPANIAADSDRYIKSIIANIVTPEDPNHTLLRWYDVKTFNELSYSYRGITTSRIFEAPAPGADERLTADEAIREAADMLESQGDYHIQRAVAIADGKPLVQRTNDAVRKTSGFGTRDSQGGKISGNHGGIDYAGPVGSPILAYDGGKVVKTRSASDGNIGGNTITIEHDNGRQTVYAHLQDSLVTVGTIVNRGDTIGLLGNTGRTTGPHLHFSVYNNGTTVDPEPFLGIEGANRIIGSTADAAALRDATGFSYDPSQDLIPQLIDHYYTKSGQIFAAATQSAHNLWLSQGKIDDAELVKYLQSVLPIYNTTPYSSETGAGPVRRTGHGRLLPQSQALIHPEFASFLAERGWHQISNDPRAVNPLFRRRDEPYRINLSTNPDMHSPANQIVTSISMAFQNRFALLPIAGSTYPAIQHLGSMDSNVTLAVALLSTHGRPEINHSTPETDPDQSENFDVASDLQRMAHSMDVRASAMKPFAFSGKDIDALTEIHIENRLINGLGIDRVVLNGFAFARDPSAVDIVRAEITLGESGEFDEELRAHFSFSDLNYRAQLREWLTSRKWLTDPRLTDGTKRFGDLQEIARTMYLLDRTATNAYRQNLGKYTSISSPADNANAPFAIPEYPEESGFQQFLTDFIGWKALANDNFNGRDVLHVEADMRTARPIDVNRATYLQQLRNIPSIDAIFPVPVKVPTDPEKILGGGGLANIIASMIESVAGDFLVEPGEIEYPVGLAQDFLSGSYGKQILRVVSEYRKKVAEIKASTNSRFDDMEQTTAALATDPDAIAFKLQWLELWNQANLEYYKRHVIGSMLFYLSLDFADYFDNLRDQTNKTQNRQAGCYRDLFLANDLDRNPYDWLDNEHQNDIREAMAGLVDRAIEHSKESLAFNHRQNEMLDQGISPSYRRGNVEDLKKAELTAQAAIEQGKKGVNAYHKNASGKGGTVAAALSGLRSINPGQFSIRRSFPAFRFYIVEENNVGVIRAIDELYSYNAIIDWTLVQYQNRPATLVMTMTNLFNHLDSVIISDDFNNEQIGQLSSASNSTAPLTHASDHGINTEEGLEGTSSPIQSIFLKPGAKVILKAGYENDPDKLETIFCGRVAEVQAGDVMSVVCEDWTAELLGTWDPALVPTQKEVGPIESTFTDHDIDITGTAGTYEMLRELMYHSQAAHFGHWQIGQSNIIGVNTYNEFQSENQRNFLKSGVVVGDRSLLNIRPTTMPYMSAFGGQFYKMEDVPYEGRSLWEIIQSLRLRHPGNIAMVRPFGQGDATLYFGPTWGSYVAHDSVPNQGTVDQGITKKLHLEAFRQLIAEDHPISMNFLAEMPSPDGLKDPNRAYLEDEPVIWQIWWNKARSWVGKKDSRASGNFVRLTSLYNNAVIRNQMYQNAGLTIPNGTLKKKGTDLAINIEYYNIVESQYVRASNPDSPIVDQLFEVHEGARKRGIPFANRNEEDYVVRQYAADAIRTMVSAIETQIQTLVTSWANDPSLLDDSTSRIRSVNGMLYNTPDPSLTLNGEITEETLNALKMLRGLTKPVRQWHIVNSRQHIISNQMTLSNRFFNRVSIGTKEAEHVSFDPGLIDVRTRTFPEEFVDHPAKLHAIMAQSLLRDEVSKMYDGEILLVGNPEIRPHDMLVLFDESRQIYGAVEVRKVVHTMSLDHGFISIVTPGLLTEPSDNSWSHAVQAFHAALSHDIENFSEREGSPLHQTWAGIMRLVEDENHVLQKSAIAVGYGGGAATAAIGFGTAYSAGFALAATGPVAAIVGGLGAIYLGWHYFSYQNAAIEGYARRHPLTITPVTRRGLPWMGGLDGAEGRTMIAQMGTNMIRGIRSLQELAELSAKVSVAIREKKIIEQQVTQDR